MMSEKEHNEILHDILHDILEMLTPLVGNMKAAEAWLFIDKINDVLSKTPFMLLITGDGKITVMLRPQAVLMAKIMFNKPYGDYQKKGERLCGM